MAAKDLKKSEAALIRWDPHRRKAALYERLRHLLQGYVRDHGQRPTYSREQTYVILAMMGYRLEHTIGPLAQDLIDDEDLEILN